MEIKNDPTTTTTTDDENIEDLLKYKIKCFQHCIKSERLLCFKIPEKCPTCSQLLNTSLTTFLIPPFILPTPLTITTNQPDSLSLKTNLPPYSLLLQPTNGNYKNFLLIINSQQNTSDENTTQTTIDKLINDFGDLHIGITNSKSEIFDFDLNGLNRNSLKWFKIPSIVIKLNHYEEQQYHQYRYQYEQHAQQQQQQQQHDSDSKINDENLKFLFYNFYYLNFNKWDFILDNYWYNQRHTKWSLKNYNELKFNCLDFIIQFLIDYDYKFQNFNLNSINSIENLKFFVSNQIIEPEFIKCFKYINLLIKIKTNGFFIETIPSSISSTSSSSSIKLLNDGGDSNENDVEIVNEATMSRMTTITTED